MNDKRPWWPIRSLASSLLDPHSLVGRSGLEDAGTLVTGGVTGIGAAPLPCSLPAWQRNAAAPGRTGKAWRGPSKSRGGRRGSDLLRRGADPLTTTP